MQNPGYDSALTQHQDTFAQRMGEATRTVRGTLFSGIIGGTLVLAALGAWTGWRTIRTINQSERSLIEGRRRFRDVAECAADWFWETDPNHRFVYLSNRLKDILGLEPERYIGLTRAEANDASEVDREWQQLHKIMDERLPFREFEYDRFDGVRSRRVRISGKPFFDLEGRFCGYRGAGQGVTAARDAAAKLREAKETAEAASRSKSEFLANMSHELRTPLNAVIGFSEVMRDRLLGPLDVRYAAYAGDINRSGQHLLQVINDILDLSRIEAGRLELQRERVNLRDETQNAVRLLGETAAAAGVELCNHVDVRLPEVFVDPKRLRQILLNLVGNAIKFSNTGGHVTVGAEVVDGLVMLRVSDEGVGIPEDQLARVLEPFGQADQSLSRPHDGVGLGLALVQRFAQLHGGRVEVSSRVGEGTTVTVVLVSDSDQEEQSSLKAGNECLR
ncbi:hypothetical protein CKO28_22655 [Rhodovibrio sodomensis]|uniref:histidine kinase n=1 Tax=Rhodovibrio sodomensis TaxID=1088 RepID=A0ABS1DLK0_9PROT|nr:hypothetical protein [Rhodovibrio sodomensis]